MSKTINQTIYFDATAHEVYDVLMDERRHAEFTGASAKINKCPRLLRNMTTTLIE